MARVKTVDLGGLSDDEIKARSASLKEKQAVINALRGSGFQPIQQQTANGMIMPTSPWEALSRVGVSALAAKQNRENEAATAATDKEAAARAAKALQGMAPAGVFPTAQNYQGPMANPANTPAPAVDDKTKQGWIQALNAYKVDPELGRGMIEQMSGTGTNTAPSNVQEWEYFSKLPQPQQEQYLTMRRGTPAMNLGDRFAIPSQTQPGQTRGEFDVGLQPQDQPAIRGAQEAAVQDARLGALPEQLGIQTDAAVNQANQLAAAPRQRNANEAIMLLDMAEPLLETSTGSGVGALRDAAGALVGMSGEGAESAAQLKALAGLLVSKMPRMEGPQSNMDVKLYQEMAGQLGDATVPNDVRKAAIATIRQLNEKYAGQAQSTPATPPVAAPAAAPQANPVDAILQRYLNNG